MKMKYILSFIVILPFAVLSGVSNAQPDKTIWSLSYFDDSDFFHRPSDIEVDKNRSLFYIADTGNNRIVVFDFQGQFQKSIGSQGQGPGEFDMPTGLFIFEDGRIAVADYNNHRIQIFDRNGVFSKAIKTINARVADLIYVNDKYYTVSSYGVSGYQLLRTEEKFQPLVTILDEEGTESGDICVEDFPDTNPFIRALKHRVSLTLAPDKKLFLPYFAINKIQVFDLDGKKLGAFERPLPFKPILPKLLQQRTGEGYIQMQAAIDMVSQDADFGPDGQLYILTYTESFQKLMEGVSSPAERPLQKMRIDVFNPDEFKFIRSLDCDSNVRTFACLGGKQLVYIYEDEAGELILKCIEYLDKEIKAR